MTKRIVSTVAGAAVLVAGTSAFLWDRHHDQLALEQSVTTASAAAVTATDLDPLLDRFSRARVAGFESVATARTARLEAISALQRMQARERARQRARAAAIAAARTDDPDSTASSAGSEAATPRPSGGLLIGDSVSLGAESCLDDRGYRVDSEVGRQFSAGLERLRVHAADGLPATVVIHLGTNGPFSSDGFDQVMALTGSERRVVWVTIELPPESRYSFVDSLNTMIRSKAAEYDNVEIADFGRSADSHREWMAGDGVHITGSGCAGFTEVVDDAVTRPA